MKKIFIGQVSPISHAVDKQLLNFPPKGYEVIVPKASLKYNILCYLLKATLLKKIYNFTAKPIFGGRTHSIYSFLYNAEIPKEADIVMVSTPIDKNIPYILTIIDTPYGITGHNYSLFMKNLKEINRLLASKNCKAIVVPLSDCYNLCKKYFDKKVHDKIIKIHFGVNLNEYPKRNYKKVRFLFMGSLANPDDFEIKGGIETLEAFAKLYKDYREKVELVIRCKIPHWIKEKYNFAGIKIMENRLSDDELKDLYLSSHVFLSLAHMFVAMAPLEAESFGMPIIGLDVYGVNEYIKDNINGFLIKPSSKNPYHDPSYLTIVRSSSFLENIRNPDKRVINDIYTKMKKFIDHPGLIGKMGKASHKLVKSEFSLEKRNEELKKVFDKVIKDL